MALVTLTTVAEDYREFETQNGKFIAFKVWAGDDVGEVVTKADTYQKRLAEFNAIIGKPTELVVQDQGNFPDGSPKPKKIKFPQQGQGQGKRDYVPRWTDTEAGARWADDRIDRRRALELAVQAIGSPGLEWAFAGLAEEFYAFLKGSSDVEPAREVRTGPGGMAEEDRGASMGKAGPPTSENPWATDDAQGGEGREQTGPPALVDTPEQRKDFRTYLASMYGTADSLMMARTLFQTQVRKIPNLMGLDLEELIAIDTEFKQRKTEAPT